MLSNTIAARRMRETRARWGARPRKGLRRNDRGAWRCCRCEHYLPTEAFAWCRRTDSPASRCRACDRAYYRERVARRRSGEQLPLLRTVRAVIEYGHEDRCIVWETGPEGFCEVVTAIGCPCEAFQRAGTCPHHQKALELLSDPHSDRRTA